MIGIRIEPELVGTFAHRRLVDQARPRLHVQAHGADAGQDHLVALPQGGGLRCVQSLLQRGCGLEVEGRERSQRHGDHANGQVPRRTERRDGLIHGAVAAEVVAEPEQRLCAVVQHGAVGVEVATGGRLGLHAIEEPHGRAPEPHLRQGHGHGRSGRRGDAAIGREAIGPSAKERAQEHPGMTAGDSGDEGGREPTYLVGEVLGGTSGERPHDGARDVGQRLQGPPGESEPDAAEGLVRELDDCVVPGAQVEPRGRLVGHDQRVQRACSRHLLDRGRVRVEAALFLTEEQVGVALALERPPTLLGIGGARHGSLEVRQGLSGIERPQLLLTCCEVELGDGLVPPVTRGRVDVMDQRGQH